VNKIEAIIAIISGENINPVIGPRKNKKMIKPVIDI
jgi:hypothetical protein